MSEEKTEDVKIGVHILNTLLGPPKLYRPRIDSLIGDHYSGAYSLDDMSLTSLLELKISSNILVNYIEDLCEQAYEAEVDVVWLNPDEVAMLASLSRSFILAASGPIGNTTLLEN